MSRAGEVSQPRRGAGEEPGEAVAGERPLGGEAQSAPEPRSAGEVRRSVGRAGTPVAGESGLSDELAETSRAEASRRPRWVSIGVVVGAARRLNRDYLAVSPGVRRCWWRASGAGLLAVLGLTALLVWATRSAEEAGMLAWEASALGWMVAELPVSFSAAMWLEGVGNGFVLWAVVLYAGVRSTLAGRPLQTLAFLLGHTLVYLPIAAGWWLWSRPRPEIVLDGLAHPGGAFHAFPSGHVVQSCFAFGLLLWLWLGAADRPGEKAFAWGCYLLLIALVGFGRLRIGAHWPSDIAAGAVIGGGWAVVVTRATARASRESALAPRRSGAAHAVNNIPRTRQHAGSRLTRRPR